MGHDHTHEILERLEALERLARSRHEERGSRECERRDHDCEGSDRHRHERGHDCCEDHDRRRHRDDHRHGDDFPEKRIIDLIVRLVSEQVGRIMEEQQARSRAEKDGGGEKRLVDLIVRLVSEHVQEIVSAELDRLCGSAATECEGKRSEDPSSVAPSSPPPAPPPTESGGLEPER